MRNKRRIIWTLIGLTFSALIWVLDIEAPYERNARRGVPADFRIHHPHPTYNWRT